MDALKITAELGIIPVVVIDNAEDAINTAKAMLKGGINVMEITLRTTAAIDAIISVSSSCPEMLVGAGTVINSQQCRLAVSAGAEFIVSPGIDSGVLDVCDESGILAIPGCVTPTEITAAVNRGLNVLKFFPASVYGGLSALKSLSGPFPDVKYIPTGGVNADNLYEYLSLPCVHAVGGSWMCRRADIADRNFEKITDLCKSAVYAVSEVRKV